MCSGHYSPFSFIYIDVHHLVCLVYLTSSNVVTVNSIWSDGANVSKLCRKRRGSERLDRSEQYCWVKDNAIRSSALQWILECWLWYGFLCNQAVVISKYFHLYSQMKDDNSLQQNAGRVAGGWLADLYLLLSFWPSDIGSSIQCELDNIRLLEGKTTGQKNARNRALTPNHTHSLLF